MRAAEIGSFEVRLGEAGPFEVRPGEHGHFQVRAAEEGPFEVRAPESGPFEVRLEEVGPFEVAAFLRIQMEPPQIGTSEVEEVARSILGYVSTSSARSLPVRSSFVSHSGNHFRTKR